MRKKAIVLIFLFLFAFAFTGNIFSADKEKEFKKIAKMGLKELTVRTKEALERKYRGEKWEQYNFPKYVYTSEAVQMG
ncbi:MAG: hypothetical protein HY882_08590, partial [Deltaproteobacteria bacterium]|nr:hypothetical protein [Deltaproteobacteria bacterium]